MSLDLKGYTPTIGVECHVQLKTRTKLFAAVENDAREAEPNTLISHICMGMPGALPVLNEGAVDIAIKAAYALRVKPQNFSRFDRKHYFYPDLPKGYQISQLNYPIILGGEVDIEVDGKSKTINVTRAHLEEDAGKSTHPNGKDYSLVDLNRAGTPLLEIVSEPELHSPAEVKAYARELYLLMRYAEVSEADLYYGNMRFDVNVSVSKNEKLGLRTETKNLNSFRAVESAVEYEINRQIDELEKGRKIVQETRGWDDAKQKTFSQRSKENAHDYRYFPDPDIPPIVLEDDHINRITKLVGPTVADIRKSISSIGVSADLVEVILDSPSIAHKVVELIGLSSDKAISSIAVQWIGQLAPKIASDNKINEEDLLISISDILELAIMNKENKLSSTQSKAVFEQVVLKGVDPKEYAENNDMMQVSDTGELDKIVDKVLAQNKKAAQDVASGEMKAIGFLVGQVMKESKGKANPQMVQDIIKKKLG